jgi:MscS family membrane protein
MAMQEIMNQTIVAGNELWRIVTLFGVILVAVVAAKFGRAALLRSADLVERHGRILSATAFRSLAKSLVFIAIAVAFPLGAAFLNMGELATSMVRTIQGVLINLAVGFVLYQMVDVISIWLRQHASHSDSKMEGMLVPIVRTSLQVTVIALTALQVVQSLTDKPLTTIIAGLGVGGLAVALAAQDTIKHFFGSLVLFADKPFQVGDRITVDSSDGVVELVGFRSTRIRTLEGALVTIPNGDLANKTIMNIGCRPYIRHRAIINVTYNTPPVKLNQALEIIQNLLKNHEGMKPDFPPRVVFDELASSSLNILVMFWYHPADFWAYKKFVEQLNLNILEQFNAAGIRFAFPTQTIHLAGSLPDAGDPG